MFRIIYDISENSVHLKKIYIYMCFTVIEISFNYS